MIAEFALRSTPGRRQVRGDKCGELRLGELNGNRRRSWAFCHIAHRKWVDEKPERSSPESLIVAYSTKGYGTHKTRNHLTRSSICRTPPASRATALRSGKSRVCRPICADGSWADARHASRGSSARAQRSPTLRPSSVRGSQSASSLPRGWSRLIANRSIESLDAKKKRNESQDGSYDSFRNPPRRSLILCFPIGSVAHLVTAVATWVSRRPSRSHRAGARAGLSTGPSSRDSRVVG
jgi:hypothetical protein